MRSTSIFSALFFLSACGGAGDTSLIGDGNNAGSDASVQDVTAQQDSQAKDTGTTKDVVDDVPIITMPDAGPPKSQVSCGNAGPCTVPDQKCCRTGNFNFQYNCQSAKDGCQGLAIPCDKAQNCESLGHPNEVCCGHYQAQGQQTFVDQIQCRPENQCTQMNQSIILCDPNAMSPCPNFMQCTQSQFTIPTYYFCK